MSIIHPEIPVGRAVTRVSRTPDEIRLLINTIRDSPGEWFIYSKHINMAAAHTRASKLRRVDPPLSMLEFLVNLEFKAQRLGGHGPCVLVRWCITDGVVPPSP